MAYTILLAKPTLRIARIKSGYSLKDLSELVGYSLSALGKIERRDNGISPKKAVKFCEVLGLEFDQLFEMQSSMHSHVYDGVDLEERKNL